MADTKPASPKSEALGKQLKDSLAQRRPRPWKAVLASLAAAVVLLALLAWWLYPRPRPGPLQVMALDGLFTADETPHARAVLYTPPKDESARSLEGHTVVFHEQPKPVLKPDEKQREIVVKSGAAGMATAEWDIAPATLAEFLVLYIDPAERRGSPRERGRIFVWPKDSKLLLVDADEALLADEVDAKASESLTKVEKEGWRVVYVCVKPATVNEFRQTRAWIEKQATLPKGPVLGRHKFGEDGNVDDARLELLKDLQNRFNGPVAAVVKEANSAKVSKGLGIRTVVLGEKVAWDGVVARLP